MKEATMKEDTQELKPDIESVVTDMLNINLKVAEIEEAGIIKRMKLKASEYDKKPFYKNGYKHAIPLLFDIDDKHRDKRQLICAHHTSNNRPFIHISLNPSGLTKKERKDIAKNLKYLLGKNVYPRLYTNGKVSRLDIACDLKNIIFEDLVFNRNRQRSSAYFSLGADGKMGSVYLGDKSSNLRYRIYDRNSKDKSKGIIPKKYPVLRIEAEIKTTLAVCDIHEVSNPFSGISIYKTSHLIDDNRIPFSFCDSICRRGLTGALQLLSENERKEVNSLLSDHAFKISQSEEIFDLWVNESKKLLKVLCPQKKKQGTLAVRKMGFMNLRIPKMTEEEIEEDMRMHKLLLASED